MSLKYNTSLWACCTPFKLCMKATCCPCVVYGRNHHRVKNGSDAEYSTFNGSCCAWCGLTLLGGFGFILQCLNRREMQEKHNLEGSGCGACCTSFCCSCCEMMQTHKELDYIQLSQKEHGSPQGYQSQPGMVAQPDHNGFAANGHQHTHAASPAHYQPYSQTQHK